MPLSSRQLIPSLLIGAALAPPLLAAPQPIPQTQAPAAAAAATPQGGSLALTIRRSSGALEVVVQGTGPGPVLQQRNVGGSWQGQLTIPQPNGLRYGPQRISVPEAGLQSVSISGSGSSYVLEVTPLPGVPLARPVVSADGLNLVISFPAAPQATQQTARLDLRQPGSVPQVAVAPPLQPRAVAPPLGDMAVGSMVLRNQSYINLSGPPVTLTLRNAPAKDALMAIAQIGGYGFVYVDPEPENSQGGGVALPAGSAGAAPKNVARQYPVSLSFRNESYAKALNSVLLASGLQARREGTIILAGPNVQGKTFGPQLSKIYRLNQASAASAADYLASLGAEITKVTVISSTSSVGLNQSQGASAVGGASVQQAQPSSQQGQASSQVSGAYSQQTQSGQLASTQTYGGGAGPLRGLSGTTDSRLQTITLIGEARLVAVAENYLRQLDLRQRQVALSVRILDVTLDNDSDIKNSFAYRYGNNFIVNDEGRLVATFNSQTPPGTIAGSDLPRPTFGEIASGSYDEGSGSQTRGLVRQPTAINPGRFYSPNNFYDLVRASIQSRSTKVLASPTLILSESPDEIAGGEEVVAQLVSNGGQTVSSSSAIGRKRANEGFVTVGEQVITNYNVTVGTVGNGNSCQPEFGIAGLTFGARVSRIDDNGFVTFTLSPQITAKTREQQVAGCGPIDILSIRRLDTGSSRVRDGQTLILTGVISDVDNQEVSKWPILGDIPLIGQFFRGSSSQRKKRELVIMVTPRILDDQQGGTYGYGYQPATADAQRFMAN